VTPGGDIFHWLRIVQIENLFKKGGNASEMCKKTFQFYFTPISIIIS
jgi:hypothetical protein